MKLLDEFENKCENKISYFKGENQVNSRKEWADLSCVIAYERKECVVDYDGNETNTSHYEENTEEKTEENTKERQT